MEMTDPDRVQVTLEEDGVARVRLNRPDKLNALDDRMFRALVQAGEQLHSRSSLRAVVLQGMGRAFCAGLDMASFERLDQGIGSAIGGGLDDLVARTHGIANTVQQAALVWRELPVPVVAAVHGVAFGGGLQIALGADVRFVTPDVRLSVMEIQWGLVPDMGGLLLMNDLLRTDVARELLFSGRVVQGDEAVTLGLATRVCPDPEAQALALARDVAQRNPDAVRAAKRLLNLVLTQGPAEILRSESTEQQRLLGSPNQVEAVRAAQEKRRPVFR